MINNYSPLISIIIPCFNHGDYIDETLNSVFQQVYTNWECIIVDNGSYDNSNGIIEKWCKCDDRFRQKYIHKIGVSNARNIGLKEAKGQYIQFLDADDIIGKMKIQRSLDLVKNRILQNSVIIFSKFKLFNDDINNDLTPFCQLKLEHLNFDSVLYDWGDTFSIPIHTALIDSQLLNDFEFSEELSSHEDWLMWINLFGKTPEIILIDEVLSYYRINYCRKYSRKILDDLIIALRLIKKNEKSKTYDKLAFKIIQRYFMKNEVLNERLNSLKNSKIYVSGLIIRKVLTMIGLKKVFSKYFYLFKYFKK